MKECPSCKKGISYLLVSSMRTTRSVFDGREYADEQEEPNEDMDFECPVCGEILAHDEDEATEILLD